MASRRSQLRYLVAIAEEGQITAAARKLRLAQPTLSQTIAQLEAELGVALLERHAHGVTLTPAGETFIEKGQAALAAETDAAQTGQALARAASGTLAVGFVGPPPTASTPELFECFLQEHPGAQVDFRDLPFPCGSTAAWLAEVDVAFCQPPATEPHIRSHAVRLEPRAVLTHHTHPLAGCGQLCGDQVLDETFIGYHPGVQREWAGFHSLDDLRGSPPACTTDDHAQTALQMLAIISSSPAITAVPYGDARIVAQVLPNARAIPLADVEPATVSLVWHEDNPNPLVKALLEFALGLAPLADGV